VRLRTNLPAIDDQLGPEPPDVIGDLLVGQKLGEGNFGFVCRLLDPRNIHVPSGQVIKMVDKKPITNYSGIASLKRQLQIMEMFTNEYAHETISKFYEVYNTENYILFRLEDAGPLDLCKRLVLREETGSAIPLDKISSILYQAIVGLCHMHIKCQIVHRDLKPENMIISETTTDIVLKYIDFDTAQVASAEWRCHNIVGTFPFMAPEVVLTNKYSPYQSDIWSLGVVLLEVVTKMGVLKKALNLPSLRRDLARAAKEEAEKLTMEIIKGHFTKPENVDEMLASYMQAELRPLTQDMIEIIKNMMNVEAGKRWTAAQLLDEGKTRFGPTH
jgi:serine/threonine protein kinase